MARNPTDHSISKAQVSSLVRLCLAAIGWLIIASCTGPPLRDYVPKNDNESLIVHRIMIYQKARNDGNVSAYLACLHDSGSFSFIGDYKLSKSELAKRIDHFWKRLKAKELSVYPIARESITGDFFDRWQFVDPVIEVDGEKAWVETICKSSLICQQRHFISLCKIDDTWLISSTDWQHF